MTSYCHISHNSKHWSKLLTLLQGSLNKIVLPRRVRCLPLRYHVLLGYMCSDLKSTILWGCKQFRDFMGIRRSYNCKWLYNKRQQNSSQEDVSCMFSWHGWGFLVKIFSLDKGRQREPITAELPGTICWPVMVVVVVWLVVEVMLVVIAQAVCWSRGSRSTWNPVVHWPL